MIKMGIVSKKGVIRTLKDIIFNDELGLDAGTKVIIFFNKIIIPHRADVVTFLFTILDFYLVLDKKITYYLITSILCLVYLDRYTNFYIHKNKTKYLTVIRAVLFIHVILFVSGYR